MYIIYKMQFKTHAKHVDTNLQNDQQIKLQRVMSLFYVSKMQQNYKYNNLSLKWI